MKRKLFFITFLMLFCSSMFGQHWTMTEADIVKYTFNTTVNAAIKIQGQTPENIEELEIAAFHNGVLRGVASPVVETLTGQYVAYLVVYSSDIGELITFKLYDPSIDKEYDTDYTINFTQTVIGEPIDPVIINFYTKHWNYVYNPEENYMALPCIIKVDGNLIDKSNYEIAAFSGNQLRGVANPELEPVINIYKAMLKIDGTNGETISFKLFDVDAQKELETDYTIPYDFDYFAGDVEIEFKNNPVAMITNATGNHYFSSLEAAVAAAQNDETIKLLQDVTLEGTLTIEKSITIDGAGYEIKPADATKTYNSAIMVGNSGWGDDHGEVITLNNIEFNNWKSNHGVVRAQGVKLNMEGCVFNGNDVSNAAYGVLSLNFTDATVTNSIFEQNKDRAIDINYNGDNSNAEVTIEGCTFEKNVSDGAGIVVRNDGEKLVVTNSKFLNNTVTTTGNAAVLYAGWGKQDEVSGCTFSGNTVTTSHATTIRFASAIFCDGCTVARNAFEANTATRNGETITTTVAVGAYYGAANISENYWGGSAPVPGEDYTVEFTNNNVAINDYYKEYSEGTLSDKVTLNNVAKAGKYYYESITAAFAAVQDGETVTMLHDVNLSESIKVNNNITLDLNGKTITGADNVTPSFALIEIQPGKELTVTDGTVEKNGKITLTATNNRGWNAYSSVISNQRGKLTINGGTIEHLGGTDMAYAIDNLTNGKATSAITTIKGGTIESKYIGIRQFLNGVEATNELNITAGSINGENSAIYFQSPSVKANTGTLVITSATPIINNRIYMDVTEGATEWPVEVSIDASALAQGVEIVTSNIPAGYELKEIDGVYSVYHGVAKIGNNYYDDLSSALKAITSGCTLDILTDITIASDWDCRNTGAKIGVPVTINGNGKTIKFTGKIYDANWNTLFRFEDVATVKNLTLDASAATDIQRGITFKTSVTVDNCTLIGNGTTARYAVIVGEGATAIGDVTANITNSTFKDWIKGVTDNMNGQDMKEFAITGCTFNNTDVIISAKDKVTFTGNNMSSNSYVNITSYTVPNNVSVTANDNTNLAANTETEYNQIVAPLAKIEAQDGFLTPVAEINGKYFTTLQAAINAAAEDETVKLLADVNYSLDPSTFTAKHGDDDAALFVLADDKLTIDLNGNTISVVATLPEGAATAHSGAIINNGDLTIDDSSDEKEGKVTFEYVGIYDDGYKRHGVVMNLGTLTVNAGTLENVTELQNQQAIDNTNYNKTEVSVVINGGTIKSAGYYAIDMVGYYDFAPALKNSVVINDGTIDGGVYARIQNNTNLSLNITGGVIKSDFAEAVRYRVHDPGNTHSISITGGEFSTTNAESQVVRVQLAEGESLAGFISAGTFSQDVNEFCAAGFMCVENDNGTYGVVVDPDYGMVAKIGETRYATLAAAFEEAAQTEELTTIELLPVTISESTVKLPATLKNVTVKGAEGAVLKDMTIMAHDGNSINYEGITFDGVVFDNSRISVTGWRNNGVVVKDFTVTNCRFFNLNDGTNNAPVHFNMAATEPVNGFTFTNNVIDGATGGSKSGVYAQVTGKVIFTNNTINNVAFRPYVIQLTTDDGIADEFTVTGNTFSGSAAGRAQALTNNAEGTDEVELIVSNNIFKDITAAQQICYWKFNEATTTATLEKNYYDINVMENPDGIYYNSPAQNISELSEMGIFPIYTELNADGTINEESLFDPVAYVGTKAFETLDGAVDEVTENNNTIVVIANVENVNHLIIPAGKNVVLDLNGKTISGVCNTSSEHNADLIEVENTATLTIKDSSENEEGKVTYASGTYKTGFTVDVKGNLILESGTIELTDSWSLGFAVDVRPNAWGTAYTEASTFVMNGGKVVSSDTGVRIDSNSGETNPSSRHGVYFTMNGGDIISDWDAIFIQHRYANDLYVNIAENAGTIQGKNSPLRIYGDGVVSDVEINIAGGTFDYTGDEGTTGWVVEKFLKATEAQVEAAKIEITGGTFDADVSRFCAFNYVCTSNGDGTYGIEYKPQEEDAFVIETLHELEAFRDAVNAGNTFEGQTVVLSAGVNLNPTRAINIWEPIGTQANPFNGTFDGGDHTISNLVVDGGSYVGLFGYANEATIKNVKIENANVKGTDCVGVIAGSVYSKSTIENCHISGLIQVEGLTKVGGIHGYGYAKIINSSVVGNNGSYVKGTYNGADKEGDNVGGIVGHGGEGNTISACTVKNISVIGTRKVGGIVGTTDRAKVLDNCLVDGIVIENTAEAAYAGDNVATTTIGGLIGNYHGTGKGGSVINCVVKNVTFNVGNAKNVGPIVGGYRLKPNEEITDVTASGNLIYMSTITGSNNLYLMNAVAKIDETKYYTLFDAVKAAQGGTTTITLISNTSEEFAINNTETAITLDLNGNELTGAILPSNAKLTVKKGTIVNEKPSVSAIEINVGSLTLNKDVTIKSARHAVRIDGNVIAEVNGGEYTLIPSNGVTQHAFNISGNANVTINGGKFVGPAGTSSDSGSAVNVKSGAIVTINGGDFSGGKNHTLSAAGTLTVKGGTFDQVVKGSYLAEGYVCQMNADNKYEVFFAVASITNANGTLYYASLQAAINAAENGETVKVEANVEATVMPTVDSTNNPDNCLVYVANDKTIIIDLNGKTITVNGSDEAEYDVLAIRNHGNLTITDSNATAGTIMLNYDGTQEFQSSQIHSTILNFGTLTIDKVNIVNNATKGYTSHAIFNYSWGGNAILTINGGVISSVNKGYSVYSQAYDDFLNKKCEVYINGGTLSDGLRYDNTGYHAANGANVVITGGVFETNAENKPSLYIGSNGTTAVAISGGTFSEPVLEEYCAAGYIPQDNGNGTYGVKLGQYVAQVGDVKYETLVEAVAAVSATDNEIIILANSAESVSVPADVIINLNEIETEAYITAGGNLTFKGNGSIKTLKSIVGGTITVENGKTLALNNFIFGSSDNASATYTIIGGTITANYGFFQHGVYALYSNFETGYMYYSFGSDITVYGTLHSEGEGDGLDYVRGRLTIANGGKSIHDKTLWVGQPASWGAMEATLIVEQGGYVKANSLRVYSGSALQIDATGLTGGETIDEVECNTLTVEGTVEAINNDKVMAVVEGNKIMIKAKPVMIVETDAYYATLAEAFAAANNQTVKVLQNITLTETVTIAADKTVILDLNGKTISAEATFAVKAIVNNGTLTINGNGGTIDISASTTESIQVVDNYGTLTINGGTYKGATSNYSYAIRANDANSVTNIVDATITTHFGAIGINKGVTTITDGKFEVTSQAGGHALYVVNAEVTINGGEFIPYANGYSYAVLTNDANAKVSITGGTFKKGLGDSCVKALSGNIIITGGTFSTDVNAYCHEYYDAVTEDNITWTVEQVLFAQTTSLQGGWNWFSSYVDIDGATGLSLIQSALGSNGVQIKNPETGRFSQYSVNPNTLEAIWSGSLRETSSSDIYAIRTLGGEEITHNIEIVSAKLDPADPSNTVTIRRGWNYVAYPLDVQLSVNTALGFTPTMGDVIKSKDQSSIYYGTWVGQLTNMIPGQGYMYQSNNSSIMEFNFEYPSTNNRESTVLNIEAIDYYWNVDAHNYSGNMTMIALLETNDEIMQDGYEIAAFANGECRGTARPVYVESVDAYILVFTVNGEDVEELSFKCYDVNTGVEYNLNNRINYSNDAVVGSIDEPYMFNLDMLNIGETSVENISIYPNPTTTGREIQLQAVCDKVEVFNALGVKIAEYSNVDSIDAIETAGVYVIRLTIDNSARNCRLIVK